MSVTLIVGDLHLGKGLSIGKPGVGNALNSRVQDQVKLLNWCLDRAVDNHASSIILTGDICEDPKPDYVLLDLFIEWLKACESNNIEVHIIVGNHDIKRTGSHYLSFLDLINTAELPLVYIHKYINTVYFNDVGFTLVPFRDKNSLEARTSAEAFYKLSTLLSYEAQSIPSEYDKVLIGHLALKGSMFVGDEFDNLANELMCPLDMFNGYDYVWMGHVHKPQVRRKKNPYLAHIGSLDISDFGETDHQKIVILYDTENPNKFTEIPVPSRPLRRIRVDIPVGFNSTNYVIDQARAMNQVSDFNNSIVKIEVKHLDAESEAIDRPSLYKAIYDLGAYHICNLSESKNSQVVKQTTNLNINSKVDMKTAIKTWASLPEADLTEEQKDGFLKLAFKMLKKFQARHKR